MQASTWICIYQMQSIKVHELAPAICVFLLSKNFDPSLFFNVAPSLSMSMSYLYFFELSYLISPPCTILISKLSYLYTISLPLSLISIKGMRPIDAKACIRVDGWHLNLVFFMDSTSYVGMTPLEALKIPHVGSLTLIPIGGAPPLCHSMGHPLDNLELL